MSDLSDRLGVQVMDGFASIPEIFNYLKSKGIKVVEINLNNPHYLKQLYDERLRDQINRLAADHHISWTVHLPEDTGFFNIADSLFNSYLLWLAELQKNLAQAGCKALTAHIGSAPHFAWSGQRRPAEVVVPDYYPSVLKKRLLRAADMLVSDPGLCFENVGAFHQAWLRETISEIGSFAYTMDIGHLKVAHPRIADAEFAFYTDHIDQIKVVHVHDNDGQWDQHMPVTDPQKIEPYWGLAKQSKAYLIMEVRPLQGAISSLETLA